MRDDIGNFGPCIYVASTSTKSCPQLSSAQQRVPVGAAGAGSGWAWGSAGFCSQRPQLQPPVTKTLARKPNRVRSKVVSEVTDVTTVTIL